MENHFRGIGVFLLDAGVEIEREHPEVCPMGEDRRGVVRGFVHPGEAICSPRFVRDPWLATRGR